MSPSRFTFATVSVAVATLIALTACGGGSSTSPTSTGGATSNPSTPSTPVTVTVMDGLIRNAKVCVDSNNNNACDAGEIQGSTDANGDTLTYRWTLTSKPTSSTAASVYELTGKTLDGLFFMIGEEERKIRQNPAGAGSAVLQRVFGALR